VQRTALRAAVVGALTLAVVGSAASSTGSPLGATQAGQRITAAGVREHLAAFQRIARRNGGTRAAATPGYAASARYVATRMRSAGYAVRMQEFTFPYVFDRSAPSLRALRSPGWDFRPNRDYATLAYSGGGTIEAEVVAVDLLVPSPRANASTSGCEQSDFAGFPRGAVALVQRGTCTFRSKVANAVAAGADAVVVFNEGNAGRTGLFAATLGPPQVRIPALAASFEVGEALRRGARTGLTGARVSLTTDVAVETRRSHNVVAEARTGNAANLVVAGAHLDSVAQGPGLNDNASGSAALLEVAEQLARTRARNRLRFVWWGAEELGLIGSRHYVGTLSSPARQAHALYLNLDMVGSPNYVLFVYDGDGSHGDASATPPGSAAVERALARYFTAQRIPFEQTQLGGSSDHAPFAAAGIPVGGLFTGADGRKSSAQAATFGGRAGEPFDPCYHRACDGLANVDETAVVRNARAAAHALSAFAQDVTAVRRAR
jgi:Zn-dependent M28 family amino/carboxypeptidase